MRPPASRLGLVVVAASAFVMAAGCATADHDGASDSAGSATHQSPPTKLLISEGDGEGAFEAMIKGRIGINERGCVTVANDRERRLLVAPRGSTMSADGKRVSIAGVGDFDIGDQIEASGGVFEPQGDQRECLTGDEPTESIALTTP